MRFASIRINLKGCCAAAVCLLFGCVAICLAFGAWTQAATEYSACEPDISHPKAYNDTSDTDEDENSIPASEATGLIEGNGWAEDNPDYLGDVGGEFDIGSDSYDGELSVPANISLSRIDIAQSVCRPLDSARVSSLFGYRLNPVTGKYRFHSGYDLAAAHGADIYAMYSGSVSTAGWDDGYGNYIILSHEGNFQTLYAHCSELLCQAGDSVEAGDVIALVGSTGNSTGAHLHVEFRRDGKRYDPEWVLGGLYG